jgi:hypothetical protein
VPVPASFIFFSDHFRISLNLNISTKIGIMPKTTDTKFIPDAETITCSEVVLPHKFFAHKTCFGPEVFEDIALHCAPFAFAQLLKESSLCHEQPFSLAHVWAD